METRKKIRFVYRAIVIAIMLMFAYGIVPSTLADIMKDKVEDGYEYHTVYKTKVNGEYDIRDVKISDPKGNRRIMGSFRRNRSIFQKDNPTSRTGGWRSLV